MDQMEQQQHGLSPSCPAQQSQHHHLQDHVHMQSQNPGHIHAGLQQRQQQLLGPGPGHFDHHGFGSPWMLQNAAAHGPPPAPWAHHAPHHHHHHAVPMQPPIPNSSQARPPMPAFDTFFLGPNGPPNLQPLPSYHHIASGPQHGGPPGPSSLYHPQFTPGQLHHLHMNQSPAHGVPPSQMVIDHRLPGPHQVSAPAPAAGPVNLPSMPAALASPPAPPSQPPFTGQLPDRPDLVGRLDDGMGSMPANVSTASSQPPSTSTSAAPSAPSSGHQLPYPRSEFAGWRAPLGINRSAGEDEAGLPPATSSPHRRRNTVGRAPRHAMPRVSSAPQDSGDGDQDSDEDIGFTLTDPMTGAQRHNVDEGELLRASQFLRGTVSTKMVASPSAISSLQSVPLSELDENERHCVICYNEYGVQSPEGLNEAPLRIPGCRHVFGDHCIKKWFEDSDSCPYCRTKVPSRPRQVTNPRALMNFIRMQRGAIPSQLQNLPDEILLRFVSGRGDELGRRSPPSPGEDSPTRRRARTRHSTGRSWQTMMAASSGGVRPSAFMALSTSPPPQQQSMAGQRDSHGVLAGTSGWHQRRSSLGSRLASSQHLPLTQTTVGRQTPHTRHSPGTMAMTSEDDAYIAVGGQPMTSPMAQQALGLGNPRQVSASSRLPGLYGLSHPRQTPDMPGSAMLGPGEFVGQVDMAAIRQDDEQPQAPRPPVSPTTSW